MKKIHQQSILPICIEAKIRLEAWRRQSPNVDKVSTVETNPIILAAVCTTQITHQPISTRFVVN